MDALSSLGIKNKKISANGDEIASTNYRDDGRKTITTWQIVDLEMKKYGKSVKAVSYCIKAANCNVFTMMQYCLCTTHNRSTAICQRMIHLFNKC